MSSGQGCNCPYAAAPTKLPAAPINVKTNPVLSQSGESDCFFMVSCRLTGGSVTKPLGLCNASLDDGFVGICAKIMKVGIRTQEVLSYPAQLKKSPDEWRLVRVLVVVFGGCRPPYSGGAGGLKAGYGGRTFFTSRKRCRRCRLAPCIFATAVQDASALFECLSLRDLRWISLTECHPSRAGMRLS